jgi:thiamine transport system substrate-binding protein
MVVKKKRLVVFAIIIIAVAFALHFYNKSLINGKEPISNLPELRIYTYSSFATTWGPGPLLKKAFEEECNCTVKWLTANDSRTIIQKIELQKNSEPADLILGLDFLDTKIASERLSIKPSSVPSLNSINWSEVILKTDNTETSKAGWVPFDWGLLTFNTHKDDTLFSQVKKLDDLLDPKFKSALAIEDPRTSSPGLLFLFWLFTIKGEDQAVDYLKKLAPNVHSYGSSWSTSYGLFTEGQAKAVFSYTTSPVYHLIEEKKSNFMAINFEEPLPMHIEYGGILNSCSQCELADKFLIFLLRPKAQQILMTKNFMYPVITGVAENTPFDTAKDFRGILVKGDNKWLELWKSLQRNGQ